MKKLTKMMMALAIAACFGFLTACSDSKPSPDEVMSKINSGEKLELADYETMLDYLEEFVEEGEDSPNTYEAGQEIAYMYPYFLQFSDKVVYAPAELKNGDRYNNVMRRFIILMNR